MPSSKIDSAILRALNLDAPTTTIKSHSGSGFTSTYRLTTPTTSIFLKTSSSKGAKVMFEGEHASLNAIHAAVPSLCGRSLAWGNLEDANGYFLSTEFLDMGSRSSLHSRNRAGSLGKKHEGNSAGSGMSLAAKMGKLHSIAAPTPEGYDKPQFGFPVTTCCGDTPQDNSYRSSWSDFYGKRLLDIAARCEQNNGPDAELKKIITRTVETVVPRLLADGHLCKDKSIVPVVVHGDLWSGNKGRGSFIGRSENGPDDPGTIEDVVFDPSAYYGCSEVEWGISRMFGGFGNSFWEEYHSIVPKMEPVEEYEDRMDLYESYHHLNHHAIFGGGYRSGAMRLLKGLLKKYGDD